MARLRSLYVGEEVTVRIGSARKTGEVLELGEGEFCIQFPDGSTRWVKNSAVVQ